MATPRVKSRWFRDHAPRTPSQVASAAAAVVWRKASHRIRHLRSVGFGVDAGEPYVRVLVELLCFLIAIADRIALAHDPGAWRTTFTSALATRVADLFDECFVELLGPDAAGDYRNRFIERVNRRLEEYGQYRYADAGPEFAFLRHFGDALADALPCDYDRRWAADQAMSVEGPATAETLAGAMRGLLGQDAKPRRALAADA